MYWRMREAMCARKEKGRTKSEWEVLDLCPVHCGQFAVSPILSGLMT